MENSSCSSQQFIAYENHARTQTSISKGIKETTEEQNDLCLSFPSPCKFYTHLIISTFRLHWKHHEHALKGVLQHTKQLPPNQLGSPLGQTP